MRQTQRDTQLTALRCVCACECMRMFMCKWYACVCVSMYVRARDNSMTYVLCSTPKSMLCVCLFMQPSKFYDPKRFKFIALNYSYAFTKLCPR